MKKAARLLILIFAFIFFACTDTVVEEAQGPVKKVTTETEFANSLRGIPLQAGIVGIFTIPEMLCLSVMDSTRASDAAQSVERSYAKLGEELMRTKAIQNGPYGQISYSNDTANFKYECFVLIQKMPATSPKNAKVVVLETTKVLAYNYYGPYQELHIAYAQVKDYLDKKKMVQWGPMREYYITDPRNQPDPKRWRTLLLVPVRRS
jgi:effector-binding domain-containing protein